MAYRSEVLSESVQLRNSSSKGPSHHHLRMTRGQLVDLCLSGHEDIDARFDYPSFDRMPEWFGHARWDEALEMAQNGWAKGSETALALVDQVMPSLERVIQETKAVPQWQVAGGVVDIGRYLAGAPDCMIQFQQEEVSKVGKVVTLVIGVCVSAGISGETILARGAMVTALAMALDKMDHAVEIWIDHSVKYTKGRPASYRNMIRVKEANEFIEPELLAYWLSHPTVLRRLGFQAQVAAGTDYDYTVQGGLGHVEQPDPSLYPEGAIITPSLRSYEDVSGERAVAWIKDELRKIGLMGKDEDQ